MVFASAVCNTGFKTRYRRACVVDGGAVEVLSLPKPTFHHYHHHLRYHHHHQYHHHDHKYLSSGYSERCIAASTVEIVNKITLMTFERHAEGKG